MSKRGCKWPLRLTARGGITTTDDSVESILALSLLPGSSSNPFNARDGIGAPDWTWSASGPAQRASVRARVVTVFNRLEAQGRARLESVAVDAGTDSGELSVSVGWTNLETGQSDAATLSVGEV